MNAIRETFEETGILLTVKKNLDNASTVDQSWRDRVHKNPSEFLRLCQVHELCPDIWSLSEWADWLTPLHLKTKSRFDTIFYAAFQENLDESKAATDDNKEVSDVQFMTPGDALRLHSEEKIWLAPPQVYEMSRLAAYETFGSLQKFAQERAQQYGVETWFPVFANCSDGGVALYPGDDAYPEVPDFKGKNETEKVMDRKNLTVAQFSSQSTRRNRMEMLSLHNSVINCNIQDSSGHRPPAAP